MSIIQSFFFRANPTYSVTPSTTSVNEGDTVTFTVTTTNVPNGTTLYFETQTVSGVVLGAGVANDFTDGYVFGNGSFTINNNTGSFTRSLRNDGATEGPESFRMIIKNGEGTTLATSSTVTINDTSVLTYTITPSTTSVNEGDTVTFTVTSSSSVSPMAILYWTTNVVSGTVNASDFSDGRLTNAPAAPHGHLGTSSSFTRTLSSDLTTEGSESFQIQLRSDSTSGPILATSSTVTINDTSVASPLSVEVLMMGGGGGTTSKTGLITTPTSDDTFFVTGGGGGGAGGLYIYSAALDPGTSRTVTIGGGGSGNTNGSVTSFTGASDAVGGGYGSASDNNASFTGIPGGSGGGGSSGGAGGSGTPGQGNPGGGSSYVFRGTWGAGGGGGKGSAGVTVGTSNGGNGGSGYDLATFRGGTSLTVAFGGGGAGVNPAFDPSVGLNGDGSTSRSAAANTGGGSRNADSYGSTGTGGSGRVIVRYAGSVQKATGGTVTTATVGGNPYTIHDFTGNGTFSVT